MSRKRWHRRRAEACRGRRGRFARDRARSRGELYHARTLFDPERRAREKQASRDADYARLAHSPGDLEQIRRKNAFIKPEQCHGPIDWSRRNLRAARRSENAETPGPRLADLEREVVRELNGRK